MISDKSMLNSLEFTHRSLQLSAPQIPVHLITWKRWEQFVKKKNYGSTWTLHTQVCMKGF